MAAVPTNCNPEPQEPSIVQPLVQETSNPRTKTQRPKADFKPIYDKPKKEVKIDDLQRETKETRNEIGADNLVNLKTIPPFNKELPV